MNEVVCFSIYCLVLLLFQSPSDDNYFLDFLFMYRFQPPSASSELLLALGVSKAGGLCSGSPFSKFASAGSSFSLQR